MLYSYLTLLTVTLSTNKTDHHAICAIIDIVESGVTQQKKISGHHVITEIFLKLDQGSK
jgi:hypothetical protein